jgi:hypothetical protein
MHKEYNTVPLSLSCFESITVSEWAGIRIDRPSQVVIPSISLSTPEEKCWVNWRLEEKDGRLTKVPYRPDGRRASSTNPDDWSTYGEVVTARSRFNGVGIVFTGSLLGIDIDHCIENGSVSQEVASFIESAKTYTEVSPSGSGLHLYLKLTEPMTLERNRSGHYECYTSGRFFTVTNHPWTASYELRTVTPAEANTILCELGYPWKKEMQPTTTSNANRLTLTDAELLSRMFSAKNGAKVKALYDGDTTEYDDCDESVADAALCAHLAFWTGKDAARIESMWLASPLGAREKTQRRKDYRDGTVRYAIENTPEVYKGRSEDTGRDQTPPTSKNSRAVLTRFSDIPPEEIQWLWEGRIARGKITLIAGDPGFGKSLLSIDLAARVSTGADWPDFPIPAPLGDTVMLSVEDGRADTIRPRLDAAGADCTRVLHLEGATIGDDGKSRPRTLSFKRDMEALEDALKSLPECRLVIVDPISAYLDDTDSHKNADVRGLLAPLAELAERLKIAVVLIQHLNKGGTGANALYRPMGSLAFVAAARAAYIVTKDKDNADRRLMLPAKNNLAKDTTGLAYSIVKTGSGMPRLQWESIPITTTADDALAAANMNEEPTETEWAVMFLEDLLANGRVPSKKVHDEAKSAHISIKVLRRAQARLGIVPAKDKTVFDGPWWWALPVHEDAPTHEVAPINERASSIDEGIFGDVASSSEISSEVPAYE